ncbi:MAG: GcrA family cell cycle regulator [Pseudohongiellaceae bacterium]
MSIWTTDRVAILMKLHAVGVSFGEIAQRIGDGITRNAVIGKSRRLGLPDRDRSKAAKRSHKVRGHKMRSEPKPIQPPPLPKMPRPPKPPPIADDFPSSMNADEILIPPDNRVKFVDLEAHQCRWPIGDPKHPDFGFCGAKVRQGKSYCEGHLKRAWAPPRGR